MKQAFDIALAAEIHGEQANSLGRCGEKLEKAVAALAALDDPATGADEREALIAACAERAWYYIVQREAMGLSRGYAALDFYKVPPIVKARVGPRKK